MRIIEPIGRISSIPPTQRSLVSGDEFCGGRPVLFHDFLLDALSAHRPFHGELPMQRTGSQRGR